MSFTYKPSEFGASAYTVFNLDHGGVLIPCATEAAACATVSFLNGGLHPELAKTLMETLRVLPANLQKIASEVAR